MKKHIRDIIIAISYSKRLFILLYFIVLTLFLLIIIMACYCNLNLLSICKLLIVLLLITMTIFLVFYSIEDQGRPVVEKNKLVNIVLGNKAVWEAIFLTIIISVIFPTTSKINMTKDAIVFICALIVLETLTSLLTKVFNKKIVK